MNPWLPVGPCGPSCVSAPQPTVSWPVCACRYAAVVATLLVAALCVPILLLVKGKPRQRMVRLLFRRILAAFGARLDVRGTLPAGDHGMLVVNNHISWLDIVVVNAVRPMRALGKSDIASWPLIGPLATRSGTIYLRRDELSTLPGTVAEVTEALRAGSAVSVTPEATTWCGMASGRLRPAFFQSAVDAGVPVLPMVLRFRLADGARTTWPSFIGDETLITSLARTARLRGLVIEAHLLPEIPPDGDRGALAVRTEQAMRAVLDEELPREPDLRRTHSLVDTSTR